MAKITKVDHLSGVWVSDPATYSIPESWPTVFMFIGDHLLTRLDIGYNEDNELTTVFKSYGYLLDGNVIAVDLAEDAPDSVIGAYWRHDGEGNLWLKIGEDDDWSKYVQASLGELVQIGFDRRAMETIVEAAKMGGETIEWKAS